MQPLIYQYSFPNGLTLLAERMPHVRSAAFSFLVPSGAVFDPADRLGLSSVLADMITRGAGSRDSREWSDALDNLGVDHGESTGTVNMHFSGSTLARNLLPALDLFADMLRQPHLPEEELEAAQSLALQDIQSLEDEPQRKVMVELARRYYPAPINRDKRGTVEGVSAITLADLKKQHQQYFQPHGMILTVAGDIQWEALRDHIGKLFETWPGQPRAEWKIGSNTPKSDHIPKEIEQTQIALAYPSVPMSDPDYYNARGAAGVLSLDMSSRLFMNVREKYGLCYSVWASHEMFKDRGTMVAYAGATPQKAQETLDRTLHELRNLQAGIEEEELDRVKIGLKSSLIMRQESTTARASSLASDWYYLGRIRPLSEVQENINRLTTQSILDYVNRYPAKDVTVVTLGPEALNV